MDNEEIIKSVFKNIYLLRIIYSFVKLYKKNEVKQFETKKELKSYNEKEYIKKIVLYEGGILEKGDLPINSDGVLKEISFSNLIKFKKESIPYGIEIINLHYPSYIYISNIEDIQLSLFPNTVHTINNALVGESNEIFNIPPNITSISFRYCKEITGLNKKLVFPTTLKTLEFDESWNNSGFKLLEGDIPRSVTSLHMISYDSMNLEKGVLPNSIKELTIRFNPKYPETSFDFLPSNIESLSLSLFVFLTENFKFNTFTSIKKLELNGINLRYGIQLYPNSLPPNLQELKLRHCQSLDEKKMIPKHVKKLEIFFREPNDNILGKNVIPKKVEYLKINKFIKSTGILPTSLTHLDVTPSSNNFDNRNDFTKMISILPTKQLNLITILNGYKHLIDEQIKLLPPQHLLKNKIKYI